MLIKLTPAKLYFLSVVLPRKLAESQKRMEPRLGEILREIDKRFPSLVKKEDEG